MSVLEIKRFYINVNGLIVEFNQPPLEFYHTIPGGVPKFKKASVSSDRFKCTTWEFLGVFTTWDFLDLEPLFKRRKAFTLDSELAAFKTNNRIKTFLRSPYPKQELTGWKLKTDDLPPSVFALDFTLRQKYCV